MSLQYCSIDYRRMDGYIIASTPLKDPIPIPFDVDGLFKLYDHIYGLANLSDLSNVTSVVGDIRYHTVEQTTAFLNSTNQSIPTKKTQGVRFSGSLAAQALILPHMVVNIGSTHDLTDGWTFQKYYPIVIPLWAAIIYISFTGIIWLLLAGFGFWCCGSRQMPENISRLSNLMSDGYLSTPASSEDPTLKRFLAWLREGRVPDVPPNVAMVSISYVSPGRNMVIKRWVDGG